VATAVRAHIAGTVWKLQVSFDDEVEEGQVVAILESMKMEMPVESPIAGRVTAIHVAPGRFVEEGESLMDLG
jgi:acetyl-CoA carboxylase biotin carboxyl carrier protein